MMRTILTQWTWMRALRLVLALMILAQGIVIHDAMYIVVGALFASMAVFNTGCCAGNSCTVNSSAKKSIEDTTYEEVVK